MTLKYIRQVDILTIFTTELKLGHDRIVVDGCYDGVLLFSLLASELLTIFKLYPSLILEYSDELIEFVHRMKCLDDGFEQFFTNVVSLVRELYSSRLPDN